jgi:hypothetical protein
MLVSPVYTSGEEVGFNVWSSCRTSGPAPAAQSQATILVAELDRRCARLTFGVGAGRIRRPETGWGPCSS